MSSMELKERVAANDFERSPALARQFYLAFLAYALYAVFLTAKIAIWNFVSPSASAWAWLLIMNALEAVGWGGWILRRHASRLGPVLLLLPLACTFYSSVPIALLSAQLDIFPFPSQVVWSGMLMQSLMATHLWLFTAALFSEASVRDCLQKINSWFDGITVTRLGVRLLLCIGLTLALIYVANFYRSGAAEIVDTASRIELTTTVETGKLWLLDLAFLCWMMVCALLWNSRRARSRLTWSDVLLATVAVVLFMSIYLRMGNRSELSMFIGLVVILLCLRGRTGWVIGVAGVSIPILLYVGVARALNPGTVTGMAPVSFYLNLLGEFVFPHYPLLDLLNSHHDLWLGWSYARLPAFVVPSFGLWHKPLSLALLFARHYGGVGGMGYAYTPLGEGVANFGQAAIVIVPLASVSVTRALASSRWNSPVALLMLLSVPSNVNRGEFQSIVLQLLFFTVAVRTLLALARLRFDGN